MHTCNTILSNHRFLFVCVVFCLCVCVWGGGGGGCVRACVHVCVCVCVCVCCCCSWWWWWFSVLFLNKFSPLSVTACRFQPGDVDSQTSDSPCSPVEEDHLRHCQGQSQTADFRSFPFFRHVPATSSLPGLLHVNEWGC